jgi:hypothetical protein
MVKLTFILIGIFIVIHFTLYYWNIDPFYLYTSKTGLMEELKKIDEVEPVVDSYDFGNVKDNLEDCLNELKKYNTININNESLKSLD